MHIRSPNPIYQAAGVLLDAIKQTEAQQPPEVVAAAQELRLRLARVEMRIAMRDDEE